MSFERNIRGCVTRVYYTIMSNPTLSIIVVSWNGMRHLPACLAALEPQLPPGADQYDHAQLDSPAMYFASQATGKNAPPRGSVTDPSFVRQTSRRPLEW